MKQFLFLLIAVITTTVISAQKSTGIIVTPKTAIFSNQKDAWDITYTYIGEVKNGKANGMGIAKYSGGNVKRYVGGFVNGMYSGRGTMLFTNGSFLTGTWANGKLNGKGANLTADGQLYVGDFSNGLKQGTGILVYKANGFSKGGFLNDKRSGRCIELWSDGTNIGDNIFVDDKRNGVGFQYDAVGKKLYEGEWRDDKWVQSATVSFRSFLQHTSFTGEKTDNHILIGPVNSQGYLQDTGFYYDLTKHKRYFGFYDDGKLDDGLMIRDDSTRFIGKLNDNGATGYCYDFKTGSFYSEGNYTNDFLDGDILDINLKKSTVYYGKSVAGVFTGKAYFFNDKDAMYSGDYLQGDFTGQGFRLESNGRCTSGTWNQGVAEKITSITTNKGDVINGTPKTLSEAINAVINDYTNYYDNILGSLSDDYSSGDDDNYMDFYNALIVFPESLGKDLIKTDFDSTNVYITKFIKTKDAAKAKAKYNEIAKQLQAASITNSYITKPVKLQGKLTTITSPDDKTETKFNLPVTSSEYQNFHVWLIFSKDKDDDYTVSLEIGEKEE